MHFLVSTGPGIGDFVQYLTLAKSISECSNSQVDFIISSDKYKIGIQNELLKYQNYVSNVYYYSRREPLHNILLLFLLRNNKYDYGILRVDNATGRVTTWIRYIMQFAGCKNMISNVEGMNKKINIPQRVHYLKKNEIIADNLYIRFDCEQPTLDKTKLPEIYHKRNFNHRVGISIGTNSVSWTENGKKIIYDVKSWPYEKWFLLAKKLSEFQMESVIFGGKKEAEEIQKLGLVVPDDRYIINNVGKTSLGESLSWLNTCDLVVGAEGGMLHCANALGRKCLTLFGGSDHLQWNPGGPEGEIIMFMQKCYPCFGTREAAFCKNHKCLDKITVDIVYKKIVDLLKTDEA